MHPLAHAPDAAAVGPLGGADPLFDERLPRIGRAVAQGLYIVVDFQEPTTVGAGVDHFIDGIFTRTAAETPEVRGVGAGDDSGCGF